MFPELFGDKGKNERKSKASGESNRLKQTAYIEVPEFHIKNSCQSFLLPLPLLSRPDLNLQ